MKIRKTIASRKHVGHGLTVKERSARFEKVAAAVGDRLKGRSAAARHAPPVHGHADQRVKALHERGARVRSKG